VLSTRSLEQGRGGGEERYRFGGLNDSMVKPLDPARVVQALRPAIAEVDQAHPVR
jgi:hypothetical protein